MRLKSLFFLIVLWATLPQSAQAQLLNVESVRADRDSAGWQGHLAFDLSLQQYKEQVLEFTNQSNLSYFSRAHSYLLLNKIKMVRLEGSSVIQSGYTHLRSTFLRKARFSPEIFLQYQYNNNLGLQHRTLAGSGIRVILSQQKDWTISFTTGLMREQEKWKNSEGRIFDETHLKSTSNISFRGPINSQTHFVLIGYFQTRPAHFLKARSILESQISVDINEHIAFTAQGSMAYDADPVISIPNWTYEVSQGVMIRF